MKKLLLSIVAMIITCTSFGQPLTGTKNIPADYATIAAAIADLNTQGVGAGGVTFNVNAGYTETITATLSITATGTSANPIIFQKSGAGANPLITAYSGGTGTPGSALQDGIWRLGGSDYLTIDGIDLYDPNTANPATMEYGYSLYKASITDGCQYNVIKNCVITLNRNNFASGTSPAVEGSKGIQVMNSTYNAATTVLTPTSASGSNSYNAFYSNTIQNCNYGIVIIGYAAPTPFTLADQSNDIGGTAVTTGNTIKNYGGGTGSTNPSAAIRTLAQYGINVSYNTVNNNDGGGVNHPSTFRGIYLNTAVSANGTISYNTLKITGGSTTSQISVIENVSGSTAAGNTININNNTIQNCTWPTATSGVFYGIYNSSSAATVNIYGNILSNINLPSTGNFYGIYGGSPSNLNIYNNEIGNITKSVSGTLYAIHGATATISVHDNNVHHLTESGGGNAIYGFYDLSSPTNESYYNNTFNNFTNSGTGGVFGIYTNTVAGTRNVYSNTINTFSAVGGGPIYGIYGASSSPNIYKNKIYDLSSGTAGGLVYGIYQISAAGASNIYNNFISDLKSPLATGTNAIIGINIGGGTTVGVYYNTIYLNATSSSATTFGTSGISVSTTPTVDFRNNIIVNTSGYAGAAYTVAYRRSTNDLTSYASTSNNNDFYAGTPGANNLIFYDGTTGYQTLADYKALVAPRDAASITENPPFVNVAANDLHISTTVATQCESGGVAVTSPINITTDYDGDTRNPVPDVGADEFAGIPLYLTPPTVVTDPASSVTQTSAILNGTVNANNSSTTVTFEFGTTTGYGQTFTAAQSPVTGGTNTPVTYNAAGLTPNSIFHYRADGTNANGTTYGLDQMFDLVPTPTINGPANVCAGSTGNVYTTEAGKLNYTWIISGGGTITSGGGSTNNTVTITWNSPGAQTVSVNYQNSVGVSAPSPTVFNVTVNPILPASVTIAASANPVCAGTSVTYTATPVNGGSTPSFQWYKGSTQVGSGGTTYSYIPVNGDVITVVMTSNAAPCLTGSPATSNAITMTVNPIPHVTNAPLSKTICSGTSTNIVLTADLPGTAFSWTTTSSSSNLIGFSNGTGNVIAQIITNIGYTVETVTYHITPTANGCTGPVSDYVVTVYPVADVSTTPLVQSICSGATTNILLTSHVVGTTFSWTTACSSPNVTGYSNGTGNLIMQTLINSGNTIETVTYHITPTANGCTGIVVDYVVVVYPLLPASVTIAASANPVCAGTGVTFTATPVNGGPAPTYQWYKGSTPVGSGGPTYSYIPVNGDVITVVMTSNATQCLIGSPATSNAITMIVNPILNASVTIAASANPVCAGTSVTFTATPTNGGTTPSYQWYNGSNTVGSNSPTYTSSTIADGDVIKVVMTSNAAPCLTGSPATSNTITMTVSASVVASVTIVAGQNNVCAGTMVTFTPTPIGGGATPAYEWFKNTVSVGTGATYSYIPANNDQVYVIMTSSLSCATGSPATSNAITMTVNPMPTLTSTLTPPTICTNTVFSYTPTSGTSGTTFSWTRAAVLGISNPAASGTGNPNETLINTTANPINVTYVYTLSANGCTNPISYNVVVTVIPIPTLTSTLTPPAICSNTVFSYIPTSGTVGTTFAWYRAAIVGISNPAGSGTGNPNEILINTTTNPIDVTYVYTLTANGCTNPNTFNVVVTVNTIITASVTISADLNPVCAGILVTFTATPVNGGTTPAYQWYKGSTPVGSGGATYSYIPVNGDVITVVMTSNAAPSCLTGSPATSNAIIMTVNPILNASVSITATSNPVCAGTSVTFTASPVNGGTTPAYQWYKGSTPVGSGGATYSYPPVNSDVITVVMTSNVSPCLTGSPATSNAITMTVNPLLLASVAISADINPVCAGTLVTFTATPVNGGTTPLYQWYNGATLVGSNSATYSYIPVNGDVITVVMTSNTGPCLTGSPATSNAITMTVNTRPIPTISGPSSICAGTTGNVYITQFGMTGYIWTVTAGGTITAGAGTNSITVTWNTAGNQTVSVNYANASGCPALTPTVYNVTVSPLPAPTITGPNTACSGSTGNIYTTQAGMTGYTWAISSGGTITTGIGTNAITVTWNVVGAQTVSVNYTNVNGCTAASPVTLNVTVNSSPVPTIAGPSWVCAGSTGNVYVTETGKTGYAWSVSAGGTITAGVGTNAILVNWNGVGAQTVSVNYVNTNGCTAGSPAIYNVLVKASPVPIITGPASACVGSTGNIYSTEAGMTGYFWYVSPGGMITSSNTTNSITVTWNYTGLQNVNVWYTNADGCTAINPTVYNVTVNALPVPTITGPNSACSGSIGNVYSTQTGMSGYTWTISAGGTITAGTGTNIITVTWNVVGAQTVSVNYTNANGCTATTPTVYNVTVNPMAAPTITGPATACAPQPGNIYTTQTGMTGYAWTVSAGGTITTGAGTNAITVTWNTAGAQTVSVNYTNPSGCTAAAPTVYNVIVNPRPTPTIAGPATVCAGTAGNVYTTQTGMTGYIWTISAGGTITGGAGTSSITVTWNTAGAQTVSVNYNNLFGCSATAPANYAVTVNTLPVPTITGANSACGGSTGNVYTTQTGMTGYTWTISAGGTITAGTGTNAITVTWNVVGAQTVSVNYTNANGCSAASPTVFNVTVITMPAPTITGYNSMCVNSGYYYYNTETGMSNYNWNISSGGIITDGAGTSQIQVFWNVPGAQWVSVNYTNPNGCTAQSPTIFNVTVNPLPDPAGSITGTAAVCAGAQGISYYTTPIANTTYYVWLLPTGATIATGAGTASITVNYASNATSGNITVFGNNICGNGTTSPPFAVTVTPIPDMASVIAGDTAVCQGVSGVIYTVPSIANATGYVWTTPAGASIVAGVNTNSITVDFSPNAVSGMITVYGTNSCGNGAISPDFHVTVNPIPPAPIITAIGNILTSNIPTGNQWYFEGTQIAGATEQTYVATVSGHYWTIVTWDNCSSDSSNHLYIIIVGIEEDPAAAKFVVYPVPNDGRFMASITYPTPESFTIKVYNNLGVMVSEIRNVEVNGTTERSFDLRLTPTGIYSVIFENSNKRVIRKILINR